MCGNVSANPVLGYYDQSEGSVQSYNDQWEGSKMNLNLHELIIQVFELFDTNPLLMMTLNWDKHPHSQFRDDKNSGTDRKCKCFETKTDPKTLF